MDDVVGTDTLDGAIAAGDATFDVQSGEGTNFTIADEVRIGAQGNTCEVAIVLSISTDTITTEMPIALAHDDDAPVHILSLVDVGHTSDEGLSIETTQEETELAAGTQRATFLFIAGRVGEAFVMSLLGYNPENLAMTLGVDEEDAGLVVAAKGVHLLQDDYGTWTTKPWKFEGFREDLTPVTMYLSNGKVLADQSYNWQTGEASVLPCRIRSTGLRTIYMEP
jgi:hypothetical protein